MRKGRYLAKLANSLKMGGTTRFAGAIALLAAWLPAVPSQAQTIDTGGLDPAYISAAAGWFDFVARDEEALDLRLEYRHGTPWWIFKPWAGIELTSKGALYGAGGLLTDIYLGERIVLTPGIGAGVFEEGRGKDLGGAIQFRPQVELGYRFPDRSRLSVGFSHISNAGIRDRNPGTEILMVTYHIPTRRFTQALSW